MARKERVTKVTDGDSFETASRKHPVRLAGVDAPEHGSRGASAATKRLKNMIEGEMVTVSTVTRDVYGRAVANVKHGRRSVNKAVKDGLEK